MRVSKGGTNVSGTKTYDMIRILDGISCRINLVCRRGQFENNKYIL